MKTQTKILPCPKTKQNETFPTQYWQTNPSEGDEFCNLACAVLRDCEVSKLVVDLFFNECASICIQGTVDFT